MNCRARHATCYLIKYNCKWPRHKILFEVMLLFLSLWCFNLPLTYCATTQQDTPRPNILKDGSTLNISLLSYDANTSAGKVLDESSILLPLSTITVNIVQIPPSIKFLVLQAHSFFHNITLSYNNILSQNTFVNGTNIGLIQFITNQNSARLFLLNSDASNNVSVLTAVQGYGRDAPVPGGCNMESPVETAPYLEVGYNTSVVWVGVPPPSPPTLGLNTCERQQTEVEMYHMYLPEWDFSRETYFEALKSMMTVQDVRYNGKKVEFTLNGPRTRRIFSSYTGTGSVYGVIAIAGFSGAAYVPAITYSCNIVSEMDKCEVLSSTFSKVLCASSLFLGLFVCFFGHRFFRTATFLLAFLAGGLVSYIVIALHESGPKNEAIVYSVIAGLIVGCVWLIFWCGCGIPLIIILPALLTLGYVVAAIVMYTGVGDYQIFESDVNYWVLFICITLSILILLMSNSRFGNIVCCGVLGAYAVIVPIDHYIGSNLKFIMLNTIRRATVKHFNLALLDPPFQNKDVILFAVWFVLAFLGIIIQWLQERGKPPFPASGCCQNQESQNTNTFSNLSPTTPLLRSTRSDLRYIQNMMSYDDDY